MLKENKPLQLIPTMDFETLQGMAKIIWNEHYVSIIGLNQVNYMLNSLYSMETMQLHSNQGQKYYFIKQENTIVGFVGLTALSTYNYINKWYVLKEHRGKGLGKAVFKLITQAFKTNLPIKLNVNRQNFTAINFYFKCGFKIEKVEDIDIGGSYFMNDFVMISE